MRIRHLLLLVTSALQLVQCFIQSTFIAEAAKRCCITRFQIISKPGRQIVTFLLFSNGTVIHWQTKTNVDDLIDETFLHDDHTTINLGFSCAVGIRHGGDAKLDIARVAAEILRRPGVGNHLEDRPTLADLLSVSQLRPAARGVEQVLQDAKV